MKRLEIELDDATHAKLKTQASASGRSIKGYLVWLLEGETSNEKAIHELAQEIRGLTTVLGLQARGTGTLSPQDGGASHTDTAVEDGERQLQGSTPRTTEQDNEASSGKRDGGDRRGVAAHYRELFPDKPRLTKDELHSLFSVGKGNAEWIKDCLDKSRNAERPVSYALAILKREEPPEQSEQEPDGIDDAAIRIMTHVISDRESEFVTNEVNPIISKRTKARSRAAAQ